MARNTYGLDLGSYEIKVYDKKQDTIWKEKNVLAVQDKKEIIEESLYELPINTNGEHLFAYIPAGVLTHEVTTDGITWVYVGGIPSGSRVLVRNVWLTVQ